MKERRQTMADSKSDNKSNIQPEDISYIIQGDTINFTIQGRNYLVKKDNHLNYDQIVEAMHEQDWDKVADLVDVHKSIKSFYDGEIEIKNNAIYYKGHPLHNALTSRLLQLYRDKMPLDHLVNFFHKLMQNPSNRAVNELYAFLECNALPITPDGYFLGYKRVFLKKEDGDDEKDDPNSGTFVDHHTKSVNNNPGKIVTMDRNMVNENKHELCAEGLHICSFEYLKTFNRGHPIVVVKVNPRDVVSVPKEHGFTKLRCCQYKVLHEYEGGEEHDAFNSAYYVNSVDAKD